MTSYEEVDEAVSHLVYKNASKKWLQSAQDNFFCPSLLSPSTLLLSANDLNSYLHVDGSSVLLTGENSFVSKLLLDSENLVQLG